MKDSDLYAALASVVEKPSPFSVYTANELWTDPHTSEQMLAFHLDPDVDISSRRTPFIDQSVRWMVEHFGLSSNSRLIDYGCGPGLYASRFAACGVDVTGIDFSPRSIAYARQQAESMGRRITFHLADYLEFEPEGEFDLATMIMCDYCALAPAQRSRMLRRIADTLSDEGHLVFDVYSLVALEQKQETTEFESNPNGGFWSSSPYFSFLASFKYAPERVSLDKYTIVEERRQREVYNWLQYFSQGSLEQELHDNGWAVESMLADVAGNPFDPEASEFAVVAKRS